MFSNAKSLKKVEALQKRTLRFSMTTTILRRRKFLRNLVKSIDSFNSSSMIQIFPLRETNRILQNQYKLNLSVPKVNQISYGEKKSEILRA